MVIVRGRLGGSRGRDRTGSPRRHLYRIRRAHAAPSVWRGLSRFACSRIEYPAVGPSPPHVPPFGRSRPNSWRTLCQRLRGRAVCASGRSGWPALGRKYQPQGRCDRRRSRSHEPDWDTHSRGAGSCRAGSKLCDHQRYAPTVRCNAVTWTSTPGTPDIVPSTIRAASPSALAPGRVDLNPPTAPSRTVFGRERMKSSYDG